MQQDGDDSFALWAPGAGIITNIRDEGGRISFTFQRPGNPPEEMWMLPVHFDQRLINGDSAMIDYVGEGPPEPDWIHSEVERVAPSTKESLPGTLHIASARQGVMLTIHGRNGAVFSRLRDREGKWRGPSAWQRTWERGHTEWYDDDAAPLDAETTALLEMLYSAWNVARRTLPSSPDPRPGGDRRSD